MEEQQQKEAEAAFNGSLQTLDRIHALLNDASKYVVNEHLLGYKANLRELFKESQGFLNAAERKRAWSMWLKIAAIPIIRDDEDNITFDSQLWDLLEAFDFWLRFKLHKHHVTMVTKQQLEFGISKIAKKYGIT